MLSQGPTAFIMNGHPSTGEDNVPIARLASLPPVEVDDLDLRLVDLHPAGRQRSAGRAA
jgi:uncharacterized protein involved in high-affinity Fe2+ transport